MIESGDVRYFCDACNVLIEEHREDSVIRCPYCGRSIRRGVCETWDRRAIVGRIEIVVKWSNSYSMKTLRSWRTAFF
jgi:predicted RNA-binding Zn-ribbon protein involved in translation (DUF1610 family)